MERHGWDSYVLATPKKDVSKISLHTQTLQLTSSSFFICVLVILPHRIVKVRETRLTGLFSNILIGLSIFLLPYPLAYIPTAVLDGLFLYMAVTALNGNQMFERITLLFMEQVGAGVGEQLGYLGLCTTSFSPLLMLITKSEQKLGQTCGMSRIFLIWFQSIFPVQDRKGF